MKNKSTKIISVMLVSIIIICTLITAVFAQENMKEDLKSETGTPTDLQKNNPFTFANEELITNYMDLKNAVNGTATNITLSQNIVMEETIIIPSEKNIKISGYALTRHSSYLYNSFFTVKGELTLENITLDGKSGDEHQENSLISIYDSGKFYMQNGTTLKNNKATQGGAVAVGRNATFNMNGGQICNNSSYVGGAIYNDGLLNINSGSIHHNTDAPPSNPQGAGVHVTKYGVVNMFGGEITDNEIVNDNGKYSSGAGVFINGGKFNMKNGEISRNKTNTVASGGGVYMKDNGMFLMEGGKIAGNESGSVGGGLHLDNSTFTMKGGSITDNKSKSNSGGGVSCGGSSTFTMESGTILNNFAWSSSGAISAHTDSTIKLNGGLISGNIAENGDGSALSVAASNITVGKNMKIGTNYDDNDIYISNSNAFLNITEDLTNNSYINILRKKDATIGSTIIKKLSGTVDDEDIKKINYKDSRYSVMKNTQNSSYDLGVKVKSITVTSELDTLYGLDDTLQMDAMVLPPNASIKDVDWSVNNSSVATINMSGILTPLKSGKVTVKATAKDCSEVSGSKQINIFTKPSPPRNLQITQNGDKAKLTWESPTDNGGKEGLTYKVQIDNKEPVSTDQLTHTFEGLDLGVNYNFNVWAINNPLESDKTTATQKLFSVPSVPQNLIAAPSNEQITLTWEVPSSNGGKEITKYVLQIDGQSPIEHTNLSDLSHTFTSLSNGQSYNIKVWAENEIGAGAEAEISKVPSTVPTVPKNLVVMPSDRQLSFYWKIPENNGGKDITKYMLQIGDGSPIEHNDLSNLSYQFTGLTNGQSYMIKVWAENEVGAGAVAELISVPRTVPSAPKNLVVIPKNKQISLSWAASDSNGGKEITRYILQIGDGSPIEYKDLSNLSYNFTELENGRNYNIKIWAGNEAGVGISAEISCVPRTVPKAPKNLKVKFGDKQAQLTWEKPDYDGGSPIICYYILQDGQLIAEKVTELNYTVINLINDKEYKFEVYAENIAGAGDKTEENILLNNDNNLVEKEIVEKEVSKEATPTSLNDDQQESIFNPQTNDNGIMFLVITMALSAFFAIILISQIGEKNKSGEK